MWKELKQEEKIFWISLLSLVFVNVADLIVTEIAISKGAVETNPFVNPITTKGDGSILPEFLMHKLFYGAVIYFWIILAYLRIRENKFHVGMLSGINLGISLMILAHTAYALYTMVFVI